MHTRTESIFRYKPHPAQRKQPENPFSLEEQIEPGHRYQRVKNHIILGQLCDFVPQIIIPDKQTFKDAQAKGELTLQKIEGETITDYVKSEDISPSEVIVISRKFLQQVRYLYDTFGLLLTDRRLANGMLSPIGESVDMITERAKQNLVCISNKNFLLYQIDLEQMTDILGNARSSKIAFEHFSFEQFQPLKYQLYQLHNELVIFRDSLNSILKFGLKQSISDELFTKIFIILNNDKTSLVTFDSIDQQLRQLQALLQ